MRVLGDVYYNKLFDEDPLQSINSRFQVVNNGETEKPGSPSTIARIVYKLGTIGVTFGHGVRQFAKDFGDIPLTPLQIAEYLYESDNPRPK